MRTIVDIPDENIKHLDAMAARENVSRAEIMRRAVSLLLDEESKKRSDDALDKYYGFLKDSPESFDGLDGVGYQRKIRSEWDHRDQAYGRWGLHDSKSQAPYAPIPDDTKKD